MIDILRDWGGAVKVCDSRLVGSELSCGCRRGGEKNGCWDWSRIKYDLTNSRDSTGSADERKKIKSRRSVENEMAIQVYFAPRLGCTTPYPPASHIVPHLAATGTTIL